MAVYIKNPLRPDMETQPGCSISTRALPDDERYEISMHGPQADRIPAQFRLEKTEARVLADAIYAAYGWDEEGDGEPAIGTMKADPETPPLHSTMEVQAKYSTKIDAWVPVERFVVGDGDDGEEAVLAAKARAFDVLTERYQGANGKTPMGVRVVGIELFASFDARMHGGN